MLKVDAQSADARAEMWIGVIRANGKPGFVNVLQDLPVLGHEWTPREIVGRIDDDAQTLNFGFFSKGTGTVWIDDVSLEFYD